MNHLNALITAIVTLIKYAVSTINTAINTIIQFVRILPFVIFACFVFQCYKNQPQMSMWLLSSNIQSAEFIDIIMSLIKMGTTVSVGIVFVQLIADVFLDLSSLMENQKFEKTRWVIGTQLEDVREKSSDPTPNPSK